MTMAKLGQSGFGIAADSWRGHYPLRIVLGFEPFTVTGDMRSKTILSISLISIAAMSSACSRNKVAAAPTPATTAAADRAAADAADRENAKLRAEADHANTEHQDATKKLASDQTAISTPIYFQFDRSDISEEGIRNLDQKVDALQRNSAVRIRVEGNADDSGSDEYNMALGQRRAASVERYFTQRGIDHSRVQIVSYGEERPACKVSHEEDCRSKNRRDEFVILSGL
jgi:peptidoglycan-associated lipoprotein